MQSLPARGRHVGSKYRSNDRWEPTVTDELAETVCAVAPLWYWPVKWPGIQQSNGL